MAVWQFRIEFVSRRKVLECFGQIPVLLTDDQIDENGLYDGIELPKQYEEFLKKLGDKMELTWLPNSSNWGDYDNGTHVTIHRPLTPETSVFARFDAGSWNQNFVETVLEFARLCNCILVTGSDNVIEPNLEEFVTEFKGSNAFRFVKNPKAFLQSPEVERLNEKAKALIDELRDLNS